MELRQSPGWANYLKSIGWTILEDSQTRIYIRKIPLSPYSLIKIQRPKNPLNFSSIDKIAKKNKALWVLIEPELKNFNEQFFKNHGFNKSRLVLDHTATLLIDLTISDKNLFKNFSENARRNIKKAQKNYLTIKTIPLNNKKNQSYFDDFLKLLKTLTKLKKFWVPGKEEYYKKMSALQKNSFLYFAYKDKLPIAGLWITYFDKTAYYLQTGITEEGYQNLANYLLVWRALLDLKKRGLRYFNFEGIYDPRFPKEKRRWINFSEFKKRFHGQLVEYPTPQIKFYNKLIKLIYLCGTIR